MTVELVETIVETVARREDTAAVDLPPLYEHVDPEALNDLVTSAEEGAVSVELDYVGHTVRIDADGSVEVTD